MKLQYFAVILDENSAFDCMLQADTQEELTMSLNQYLTDTSAKLLCVFHTEIDFIQKVEIQLG